MITVIFEKQIYNIGMTFKAALTTVLIRKKTQLNLKVINVTKEVLTFSSPFCTFKLSVYMKKKRGNCNYAQKRKSIMWKKEV